MTIQVLGLSRISFLKSYREAVRLEKNSSFASSQLLVIERFHYFRAVRLEKVQFLVSC